MSRQDAIYVIASTWMQRDNEFCVGPKERDESRAELIDALHALGVADEEINS